MFSPNTEAHRPEDNFLDGSLKWDITFVQANFGKEAWTWILKIASNISPQLEETLAKSHLQTFVEKKSTLHL